MTFPVAKGRITQGYSPRHKGIDIAPPKPGQRGVACLSPEGGVVHISSYKAGLEGNYVILWGDSGKYYYFGHFETRSVRKGQKVKEGQRLGILGMTGLATNIHTHFEVRRTVTGSQINPSSIKWEEDMVDGKTAAEWKAERDKYRNAWLEEQKQREKYRKAWKVESSQRYKLQQQLKQCQEGGK